jgi:hypothetical protein
MLQDIDDERVARESRAWTCLHGIDQGGGMFGVAGTGYRVVQRVSEGVEGRVDIQMGTCIPVFW